MNLHQQFVQLGKQKFALDWKLQSLLPEIYKQQIYIKQGCASIFEYTAKYGGLSEGVVKKVLRINKKFADKPNLAAAIETVGVHKVALLAGVATKENEKSLADQLKTLSKVGAAQLAMDIREESKPTNTQPSLLPFTIELDQETEDMFKSFKEQIAAKLSDGEALKLMLKMLKEKSVPGDTFEQTASTEKPLELQKAKSRYIPMRLRRRALEKTAGYCGYPRCMKPAKELHHRERFALSGKHDSIIPLCEAHHQIAHHGLTQHEKLSSPHWKVAAFPQRNMADEQYLQYRAVWR